MRSILSALFAFVVLAVFAEKEYLWPEGRMPNAQPGQIAAMTSESRRKGFKPDEWRRPYIEWFKAPENPNGTCVIFISGGAYRNLSDGGQIKEWGAKLTALGCQCVNLVYRTPRPEGLPIYQSAWEDGQRAVRLVRSQAKKRGFFPERVGTISISAGSHLATLLATSSQTPAYDKIDELDNSPCDIDFAVAFSPVYVLSDGYGKPNTRGGEGADVTLADCFKFDEQTPPMCLLHGSNDMYSPLGSTKIYRELRKRGIPAEVHIVQNKGHGAYGFDHAVEFLRQMNFLRPLENETPLLDRYPNDGNIAIHKKVTLWPEGRIPDWCDGQNIPYLEWYIPAKLSTKSIMIVWSGGGYHRSSINDFEVVPIRRYLNEKGMAVVAVNYRCPRPQLPRPKHLSALQDVQRAIRLVRRASVKYGLDPDEIGVIGSSAGGHLAILCATTSQTASYWPVDDIDKLCCHVQWAVALCPAYCLTDGLEKPNEHGGNDDGDILAPEFLFDIATPQMLFIHGDADPWSAMNSVKAWEHLRHIGITGELHTLAKRAHGFHRAASPGTGSYTWMDTVWGFIVNRRMAQSPVVRRINKTPDIMARDKHVSVIFVFAIIIVSFVLGVCIVRNVPLGDRRVIVTHGLEDSLVVANVRREKDASRRIVLTADFVNRTDLPLKLEYRTAWIGVNGLEIQSVPSSWHFKSLAPRECAPIMVVSPMNHAGDVTMFVREARASSV